VTDSLLKGSLDKIRWARRHAERLDALIDREIRARAYKLRYEYDPNTRYLQLVWDQPAITDPQYGLRIGDAVQQFRSALDLAVWELTILDGSEPGSFSGPKLQFPICTDEGNWNSLGKGQARGVSTNAERVIRENQPCFRLDHPDQDELAFLATLSNQDKHRVITPIQAAVDIDQEAMEKFVAQHLLTGLIESQYFVTPVGKLFKPRQNIVGPLTSPPDPEMNVEVGSSGDLALWDGALVIPTLDNIGHRVERLIRELISAAS
jgi:hypothetical protein